ncbi:tyrosine-type recombinase/integrase [Albimonas pacifica]|uniref:Site-specific recombinase XerD n=1 Tax=Albimonas pacifica TaxID=1114924 RepID=A0A1I3M110_9RHOB|nr:site-specific integrase [Albimonas pacifica]SFI90682.1 Site-specific recombinase XerD [Albimonas pacifica]
MAVMKLTEAKIRALPLGSGIWRDTEVKGLMVICHKTTKSYACQGDVRRNGRHVRTVRVKIDRIDRIGLAEAKRRAKVIMSTIQSGVDPSAKQEETGITLEKALEAHIAERDLSPATVKGYGYHLDRYLARFRKRAVADISRSDCRELFETLERRHGRTTAASVMRTVRASINTAMRLDESIQGNPVEALRLPTTPKRQVDELDLSAFWVRTEELSPVMRDLQRAFLLTGARRSSLLNARRADFDPERRILTFTHMKAGGSLMFPTGRWLSRMLERRMLDDEPLALEWIWPSPTSASGHIEEPKREGVPSPHRLRHVARSMMIAAGVGYAESALLLGQRLPGASGGYVHPQMLVESLRPHAQAFEDLVLKGAKVDAR